MVQSGGRRKRSSGKKRKASSKFLAAGKSWREHLSQYRKSHPNLSLKQQMKGASKTYRKGSSTGVTVHTSKYEVKVKSRRGGGKSRRTKSCKCKICLCDPCKCNKKRPRRTKRPKRKTSRRKRSTRLLGLF